MNTLRFHTAEFSTALEGDLDLCNGQPGSQVADWLRTELEQQGVACRPMMQEDYGWGFWLEGPLAVWVAVSYAGGDAVDSAELPEWHVSAVHEASIYSWRQWVRRAEGSELAARVFALLEHAVQGRPGVTCLQAEC